MFAFPPPPPAHHHLTPIRHVRHHSVVGVRVKFRPFPDPCVVTIRENPDGSYKIPADDGLGSCTPVVTAIAVPADPNPPAN